MAKTKKAAEAENAAAETVERAATDAPEAKKAKGAPAEDDTQYIYAGASLPGLPSGTVIKGAIPKKLDKPFVKETVVPVEAYPDFLKALAVTESREAYCYRKSAEYAKELKK